MRLSFRSGTLGLALLAGSPVIAGGGAAPVLTIGRLHYDGGGDWYANPSSLPNLLKAIDQRTSLRVAPQEEVVTLVSDELWSVPYIYMTGHGNVHFSDQDLVTLRRYLRQGGFLHADDNYGMDESIRRELARLFPDHPLVEVPLDHPIYHDVYEFPRGIPKIHEHDGKPAQGFGIFLDGRLAVYYSYQSDLGDGWEDPEVHHDPPEIREARHPHGREPVRVRRRLRTMSAHLTRTALAELNRPIRGLALVRGVAFGVGLIALGLGTVAWLARLGVVSGPAWVLAAWALLPLAVLAVLWVGLREMSRLSPAWLARKLEQAGSWRMGALGELLHPLAAGTSDSLYQAADRLRADELRARGQADSRPLARGFRRRAGGGMVVRGGRPPDPHFRPPDGRARRPRCGIRAGPG